MAKLHIENFKQAHKCARAIADFLGEKENRDILEKQAGYDAKMKTVSSAEWVSYVLSNIKDEGVN